MTEIKRDHQLTINQHLTSRCKFRRRSHRSRLLFQIKSVCRYGNAEDILPRTILSERNSANRRAHFSRPFWSTTSTWRTRRSAALYSYKNFGWEHNYLTRTYVTSAAEQPTEKFLRIIRRRSPRHKLVIYREYRCERCADPAQLHNRVKRRFSMISMHVWKGNSLRGFQLSLSSFLFFFPPER